MSRIIAHANNDIALVVWEHDQRIQNCLGFRVRRRNVATGEERTLPAWVGWEGQSNPGHVAKTTEEWPVQKFQWRDLTATREQQYTYEVVPMTGAPGHLQPQMGAALISNPVTVAPERGSFRVFFNRGLLATQAVAHSLPKGPSGLPNYVALRERIDQPGDPLRMRLGGAAIMALTSQLRRAQQEGGQCYLALYELTDTELIALLLACKDRIHIVLSNTGADDGENASARQALHDAGVDITDRMLTGSHSPIGHNKFCVYVDAHNHPQTVVSGSTNWTPTGLCAQTNNAIVIDNANVASAYLEYWNRLTSDHQQDPPLRHADQAAGEATVDGATVRLWFSPNTNQKRVNHEVRPVDLAEVEDLINHAQKGLLFLLFQPGSPSVEEFVATAKNARPALFVRGAATDGSVVDDYRALLTHDGDSFPDEVVRASAINEESAYWERELLKSSPTAHAIIHDKIVVIDPFGNDPIVVTGSHNLGHKASYANEENMLIIRGHKELARAYAVHALDVYDHYRWRFTIQEQGQMAWSGLKTTDTWQDKYFSAKMKKIQDFYFG